MPADITQEMAAKEAEIAAAELDEQLRRAKGAKVDLEAHLAEPPAYDDVVGGVRPSSRLSRSSGGTEVHVWTQRQQRIARRLSTSTPLCVLLLLLLVVTIAVIGGTYVYRMSAHRRLGLCHIPLDDEFWTEAERLNRPFIGSPRNQFAPFAGDPFLSNSEQKFFDEIFDIDLDTKPDLEDIEVPDFGNGRKGRFLHDFSRNLSGIVDYTGHRCFVMPLDHKRVSAPRNLFDMVERLKAGGYQVDTKRVRETMRVVRPPLPADADVGKYISEACAGNPIFRLVPDDATRHKRSAAAPLTFRNFAGKGVLELEIIE